MDHQHVRNRSPGLYVQASDFEFRGDLKCKAARVYERLCVQASMRMGRSRRRVSPVSVLLV